MILYRSNSRFIFTLLFLIFFIFKSTSRIFANSRAFGRFYEYLLAEKCYDEIVDTFLRLLPRSIRTNQNTENSNEKTRSVFLMDSQLEVFTKVLLLQVFIILLFYFPSLRDILIIILFIST